MYDGIGCSGSGGGGFGGAIWLQTLKTVSATSTPSVTGGNGGGGVDVHCPAAVVGSFDGTIRCDSSPGQRGSCGGAAGGYDTNTVVGGQVSYVVQSKAYDLDALNASFGSPVVTSSAGSGSITIEYAGSTDGSIFSGYTQDLTSLSNQQFRYVKFKITLATASAAAASPTVSRIEIPFSDLGPSDVPMTLGCGTVKDRGGRGGGGGGSPSAAVLWGTTLLAIYGWMRLKAKRQFE